MAFDPIQEDCLRLILEDMRRERVFPLENAAFVKRGMDRFQEDPSKLIKTDRDRSFHLTARAAELMDYRVPFVPDDAEAERQENEAMDFLREAVQLDGDNWDAQRMLTEAEAESNDAFVTYLLDGRDAVAHDAAQAVASAQDPYSREFARDLAHRPYLRWLAALASRALISGRYRMALQTAEDSLAYAPDDPAGVRHTAMLAMAKLEYSLDELKAWRRRHLGSYQPEGPLQRRRSPAERQLDPWTLLACTAAAWRAFDYDAANRSLRALLKISPHAAHALYYQTEFPEALFSRVNVMPGSEDELILAISEATPLLQEGLGAPDCAPLAAWIAENEQVVSELDARDAAEAASHVRDARPWGES